MINAVTFVSIPVHDQARALRFYAEKLDGEVATEAPMRPGMRWIELVARGLEFVQRPESKSRGTSALFTDCEGNPFVRSSE